MDHAPCTSLSSSASSSSIQFDVQNQEQKKLVQWSELPFWWFDSKLSCFSFSSSIMAGRIA
jgi:hypothetical protein